MTEPSRLRDRRGGSEDPVVAQERPQSAGADTGILVAAVGDIEDGEALKVPATVTGHGDAIAVFHDDGAYYALDDTCSHGQASLSEGWIEGGEVECPTHSARFCLRTGEVQCMPATLAMRSHRVEVRDEEVWLYPGEEAPG